MDGYLRVNISSRQLGSHRSWGTRAGKIAIFGEGNRRSRTLSLSLQSKKREKDEEDRYFLRFVHRHYPGIGRTDRAAVGVAPGDVHDVASTDVAQLEAYEVLLLGTSTWGAGDLQDDWQDFVDRLAAKDLSGKVVGLFGCGDSYTYDTTFATDRRLYEALRETGCRFCGAYIPQHYHFSASMALVQGRLVGLAADQENEPEKTSARMEAWIEAMSEAL